MLGAEKASSSRMCGQLSSVHLYCKITVPQQSWTRKGTRSKECTLAPGYIKSLLLSWLATASPSKFTRIQQKHWNTEITNDNPTTNLYCLLFPASHWNLCYKVKVPLFFWVKSYFKFFQKHQWDRQMTIFIL